MYEPRFQRTDALIATLGRIKAARAVVSVRAPLAAHDTQTTPDEA